MLNKISNFITAIDFSNVIVSRACKASSTTVGIVTSESVKSSDEEFVKLDYSSHARDTEVCFLLNLVELKE